MLIDLPFHLSPLFRHFTLKLHSFSDHDVIVIQQFSDGDRWLCNAQIWCGDFLKNVLNIAPDKACVIKLHCTSQNKIIHLNASYNRVGQFTLTIVHETAMCFLEGEFYAD